MARIPKKQIQKVIDFLRTSPIPKAIGRLETENGGMCCLGKACVAVMKPSQIEKLTEGYMRGFEPQDQGNAPRWLKGLNDDFRDRTGATLTSLNDTVDGGYDHDTIADLLQAVYIEEVLG